MSNREQVNVEVNDLFRCFVVSLCFSSDFCYMRCVEKKMCEMIVCIWLSLSTRAFDVQIFHVFLSCDGFFYIYILHHLPFRSNGQRWKRFVHLNNLRFVWLWPYFSASSFWDRFFFGDFPLTRPSIIEQTEHWNCILRSKPLKWCFCLVSMNVWEKRTTTSANYPNHEFTYAILIALLHYQCENIAKNYNCQ